MIGDKSLGIRHLTDDVDMLVLQCCEPFGHVATCQMINEVIDFFHGLGQHLVDEPANAFLVGHPVHGADVIELGLALNFVFWRKFLRINAKWDVDDGLGAVFPEESGILAGDGSNAVDGLQGVQLVFLQSFRQVIDIPAFKEEFCFFGDAFPDLVFHVMGTQHNHGLRVGADVADVGSHEKHFQLHHVKLFFFKQFDEPVAELLGDKTLHMVGFFGEEVGKGLQRLDA